MEITHIATSGSKNVVIELVEETDYQFITAVEFHFDWVLERENNVYKLKFPDEIEILGLMSIKVFFKEMRIEIVLLAAAVKNTGTHKEYDGIVGNLIAFACRESIKLCGEYACVSLHPKTELKKYYMKKYGFENAGRQIFLEGSSLFSLLNKYKI
ncbi:N-acetyltransferase [Flavobacterium sp. HSC-61S13]|uniref:N-acetyltransferase n=1 Tax=Flavobacterium sp. HSC-61S13 TaxID=2910963 RepID=UPI00209EE925|nr:N-acetyltransferase [Flavobacterium sp. HSC-61S13]MCP1995306.1 hypothetical protein [Flavobacterium sp. HSC-61S13]